MNYALWIEPFAIAVPASIAIWQHITLRAYRKADRLLEADKQAQEQHQQDRRARRDSWDPVFGEIQEVLRLVEDVGSDARKRPLDRHVMEKADLGHSERWLESLSDRCPPSLARPLQDVAAAVAKLHSLPLATDAEVTDAYREALESTPPCEPPPAFRASAIAAKAAEQYQAAMQLREAVKVAWDAVRTERGGIPEPV